jgi:hypothetical protein
MKDIYLNQTTQASLTAAAASLSGGNKISADEYVLKGLKDYEQVRVNLESNGFNGLLQLVNEKTGQTLIAQDNNNSVLTFTALPNTNYIIRVAGKDASKTGTYVLKTDSIGETPTPAGSPLSNPIAINNTAIARSIASPTGVSSAVASSISAPTSPPTPPLTSRSNSTPSVVATTLSNNNISPPMPPQTNLAPSPIADQPKSIALSASTGTVKPTTTVPTSNSSNSSVPVPSIPLKLSSTPPAEIKKPAIPAAIPPSLSITAPATSTTPEPKPPGAPSSAGSTPVATPPPIPAIPPAIAIAAPPATVPEPKPAVALATGSTPVTTPPAIPAIPPAMAITAPATSTASGTKPAVAPLSTTSTTPTIPAMPPAMAITAPVTGTAPGTKPAVVPLSTGTGATPNLTTTTPAANPVELGAAPIGTGIKPNSNSTPSLQGNSKVLSIAVAQQLQFTPGVSSAAFNSEMGAFNVDDAQGRINGILPGAPGYLAAAIGRSDIIGGKADNTVAVGGSHQLAFGTDKLLGFYLVQNGSTAEIKADLAAGRTPSHPVFFQTGNTDNFDHLKITQSGSKYTFAWEDTVGGGDRDFNDLVINATATANPEPKGSLYQGFTPLVDLRDITGLQTASVTIGGSASYDNSIGFYRVDDLSGKIGTLNPGDAGYAKAAIGRSANNFNPKKGNTVTTVSGGIFAPYLIANGTAESFLAKNPTNQGNKNLPNAYFGYIGANPDQVEHMRLLGDNKFGFEDIFGGGDRDFNDAVMQMRFTE